MPAVGDHNEVVRHPILDYLRRGRLILAVVLAFAVLTGTAAIAPRVANLDDNAAHAFSGNEVTPPRQLPPLSLERVDGTAWTSAETRGRISLFFFGYTNCPDICPLTLSRARAVHEQLGEDAGEIDVYFVTVDPERDTPERLGLYVSQFNPEFIGLTGTDEQIEAAKAAFGVIAIQQPMSSSAGYSVDHTASSFVVDQDGAIRLIYPHDAPSVDVVSDLRTLLASE